MSQNAGPANNGFYLHLATLSIYFEATRLVTVPLFGDADAFVEQGLFYWMA